MSNLYEILEVSKNASKEVIDKAYHVLAKKYHPDLQTNEKEKNIAKEKMQKINSAYEILGDEQKRKIYDLKLEQEIEEQKRKENQKQLEELRNLKQNMQAQNIGRNEVNDVQNNMNNSSMQNIQTIYKNLGKSYKQAYNSYRGVKVKEPWTKERALAVIKSLAIVAIIVIAIWFFPPTHKVIVDFYENNELIKTSIDIIVKILIGIKNGIVAVFNTDFIV